MNFKSALKYQLSGIKRSLIIFYGIVYIIYIFLVISDQIWGIQNTSIGGVSMATAIFLFVCGLNSFKDSFNMMLVNGISRKTMFQSTFVMFLSVAALSAVINTITNPLFDSVVNFETMFFKMYGSRYAQVASVQSFLEGLLWRFFLFASVAMIGYFITTLYYRMNKALKLVVSIGVPVLAFVVYPWVDASVFGGGLSMAIAKFYSVIWGLADGFNPYIFMLSSAVTIAIFGSLSYLLMRRATVKP